MYYADLELAIIIHKPAPGIGVKAFCEREDYNGISQTNWENIIISVNKKFKQQIFSHLRISGPLLATELTVAVSWISDLPGVAMNPG